MLFPQHTNLASNISATIPAASGAAAEVPVCLSVQPVPVPKRQSVVTWNRVEQDKPSNMAAPYETLFNFLKFLDYSYFTKIMTSRAKLGNLTNMTELYPFLESKTWHLLFKGILWSCDFAWKPRIRRFPSCLSPLF